ncbi:MarR family transcriptional regulator [Kitasatospora sp. Ki12]
MSEDGLKLLEEARPTNDAALREALDEAARNPELVSLVKAVEAVDAAAPRP